MADKTIIIKVKGQVTMQYTVKMATMRAAKQWSLTKQETIASFEAWRQTLQYTLSLDPNFAGFLIDGFTWQQKTKS
jgi:hypothetical protein